MKIRCKKCDITIKSMYRHDFVWCKCKNVFVDGGQEYLRYGVEDKTTVEFIKEEGDK